MNPLLLGQNFGALSGMPLGGSSGQSVLQTLQNSNLGGFGTAGALMAMLPAAILGGGTSQSGGPSALGGSTLGASTLGASPSPSQPDNSQWQMLINMLMQKLGLSSGGQNSGFLPSLGVSGIYGR